MDGKVLIDEIDKTRTWLMWLQLTHHIGGMLRHSEARFLRNNCEDPVDRRKIKVAIPLANSSVRQIK